MRLSCVGRKWSWLCHRSFLNRMVAMAFSSSPAMHLSKEVFPEPDDPNSAVIPSLGILKSNSR